MKKWIYNVVGGLLFVIGIIWLIRFGFEGGFNSGVIDIFLNLRVLFAIPPLLFILVGVYYLSVGLRKKEVNKLISSSLTLQVISLGVLLAGLIFAFFYCLDKIGMCGVVIVPFLCISLGLTLIGVILLIEGVIVGNRKISNKTVWWSIVIIVLLIGISLAIYLPSLG